MILTQDERKIARMLVGQLRRMATNKLPAEAMRRMAGTIARELDEITSFDKRARRDELEIEERLRKRRAQ